MSSSWVSRISSDGPYSSTFTCAGPRRRRAGSKAAAPAKEANRGRRLWPPSVTGSIRHGAAAVELCRAMRKVCQRLRIFSWSGTEQRPSKPVRGSERAAAAALRRRREMTHETAEW